MRFPTFSREREKLKQSNAKAATTSSLFDVDLCDLPANLEIWPLAGRRGESKEAQCHSRRSEAL